MSFYLTAGITCDLNLDKIHLDNFALLTMEYTIKGKAYDPLSKEALSIKEFYELMEKGEMPTTSQVTPFTAISIWTPILENGLDILHIAFSSALSGSYQSAETAAKELREKFPLRKIIVIDSLSASAGEGLILYHLDKARNAGKNIDEVAALAVELKDKVNHYFTVNNLFHLNRGGRVSKLSAIIGTILQLKPLLHVNPEGQLIPIDKCIGRKTSLNWLVKKLNERISPSYKDIVFISNGNCIEDAEFVKNKIKETNPETEVVISDVNPVIGAHCGQGVVALFFISEKGKAENI